MNGFLNINKLKDNYLSIQKLRLVSQARPDSYYVAKRRAKITITLGKHVTPSTDDGEYEILPNADLRLEAGETIHFTDGFHAHEGSKIKHSLQKESYIIKINSQYSSISQTFS
ncbi:MAG: hypothetical protein HYU67_12110 [Flavobacteriia bacterium]|nr:hypothetical protein [Flavobacteriia bacterium]